MTSVSRAATLSLVITLVIALAGCGLTGRSGARSADPATPYLATRLCGFLFDGRTQEARFSIDLTVQRPLPPGSAVEVSFENPLEPAHPIVVTQVVKGGEKSLRILSTPVKGIRERTYAMAVRVYASADKTAMLSTHTESCRAPFAQGDVGIEYR